MFLTSFSLRIWKYRLNCVWGFEYFFYSAMLKVSATFLPSTRLSVKKPRHYHPRKNECVIPRNPNFVPNMIDFRSLQLTGLTANGRALLKDLGVLNVDDWFFFEHFWIFDDFSKFLQKWETKAMEMEMQGFAYMRNSRNILRNFLFFYASKSVS